MKRFVALSIFGFLALLATSTYAQAVFMPAMQGVQYRRASAVVETRSVSISSSTVVEAVVNITAPAGTTLSERGVCWSTNPNPTIANFKSAYGSTSLGTATSNITSMATGNIYYVRGYATVGGSTYYGNELPMAIFYSNGADQSFTVPAGVTSATIKVLGAAGGESTLSGTPTAYGGYGASMMGTFTVTPGESISVIVGEKGVDGSYYVVKGGGGGGGTFVYRTVSGAKSPMIIAGGGGGGFIANSTQYATGQPGQAGTDGTDGVSSIGIAVNGKGTGGYGGVGNKAGGGAGWYSAGSCTGGQDIGGKRDPWLAGNAPASYGRGGYGGGGSAWQNNSGGSGGGGGYSGGGGCGNAGSTTSGSGGGGGSYNSAPSGTQSNASGANAGHGVAIITW